MSEETSSHELKIIQAMKLVLVNVIKDTTTEPGLKHPLSPTTIEDIRQCLGLISVRENELSNSGTQRPRFTDEPVDKVVVSLSTPDKKDTE